MTIVCAQIADGRHSDSIQEQLLPLQGACMTKYSNKQNLEPEEDSVEHQEFKESLTELINAVEVSRNPIALVKGFAESIALYAHHIGKDLKIETGLGRVLVIRKEIKRTQKH